MGTEVFVPVNDRGQRIGQYHCQARYTDDEVEIMRSMHEAGYRYHEIAKAFAASVYTVGRICRFERRAETIAGFKRVLLPEGVA